MNIIGTAAFATGMKYDIVHHITEGRYYVFQHNQDGTKQEVSHSKDIDACWRSIRFAARVSPKTDQSPGVEYAPQRE